MIDTHCHLIDPQFKRDIKEVIVRAQSAGLRKIINIGYDLKTSCSAIEMYKEYQWILPAIGIHPNETAGESIAYLKEIDNLCTNERVFAVGETGLDYYRNFSPKDAQVVLFRRHINIARKYNLPLIVHTRNAVEDAIRILKEEDYHLGVFHCYNGTYEQAKRIIDIGYYLGFGGVLTFSKNLREVFQRVPLDFVIFETDAPFLAPAGYRGKRNEPGYIFETAKVAASLKGLSLDEIEMITDRNASRLFSIEEKTLTDNG
ncbi:MAG: TatD family hydrolase [candidate division WOR-3 bacterium]